MTTLETLLPATSVDTLPPLNASTVVVERPPITIMQFGAGNFLRAFVDQMLQRANDAGVMNDGVVAVHATPGPDAAFDLLEQQDGLYHVLLEGVRDGETVRETTRVAVIGETVRAHRDFERYRAAYLSPTLRTLVSNTTEAGIAWVAGDDLTAAPPLSFPAKITALLADRFEHFGGDPERGLHVVCCELIEDNAATLREYVLRHAVANGLSAEFQAWVEEACTFHDTLVDRIVPGYPAAEITEIQRELGLADQMVVKGEYYGVWAIGGDPVIREVLPLDRAGMPVQFMADIRPFRAKKVRILNGLHTAMSAVGLQLGEESVRAAAERADVAHYLRQLLDTEILPSIDEPAEELRAFAGAILERFTNPYLHHRLGDIALNSLAKFQARNLPVLLAAWQAGREAHATAFALAALLLLDAGQGGPVGFEPRDDAELLAVVRGGFDAEDLTGWARLALVSADYLPAEDPRLERLAQEVACHAAAILARGITAALADLLER